MGRLLDGAHVRGGVLSYRNTDSQPWWVAPQFGAASVLIATVARRATPCEAQKPRPSMIAVDAASFAGAYLMTVAIRRGQLALSASLLVGGALRVARRPDRVPLWFTVGLMAGGTAYEHALSSTGAFAYADRTLGNVPLWLPALYLAGVPFALDVAARALGSGGGADS